MNDIAPAIDDRTAMRRLGIAILSMCGLAVGLIAAAVIASRFL